MAPEILLFFQGFLDGIVDLGLVRRIDKRELPRNFGFSVETYEGKTVVFSAITDGIRNSWINCLKKAAGLENQVRFFCPFFDMKRISVPFFV